MTDEAPVMGHGPWKNNAELMLACRQLGYLDDTHATWDATYGLGAFWRLWRPRRLYATDGNPALSPAPPIDFTDPPWAARSWHHVVYDPPYKLNGRPDTDGTDARYGVGQRALLAARLDLIAAGVTACADVLGAGYLLVKCMDQVCLHQVRWQTDLVTERATAAGLRKVDRFDMPSYRPQPAGRRQVHARRNTSQLLVFAR